MQQQQLLLLLQQRRRQQDNQGLTAAASRDPQAAAERRRGPWGPWPFYRRRDPAASSYLSLQGDKWRHRETTETYESRRPSRRRQKVLLQQQMIETHDIRRQRGAAPAEGHRRQRQKQQGKQRETEGEREATKQNIKRSQQRGTSMQ